LAVNVECGILAYEKAFEIERCAVAENEVYIFALASQIPVDGGRPVGNEPKRVTPKVAAVGVICRADVVNANGRYLLHHTDHPLVRLVPGAFVVF
jgi:hypothetical protein